MDTETTWIKAAMCEYFKVKERSEMLTHLYTTFDKSFYAGFALKVVEGAKLGDAICVKVRDAIFRMEIKLEDIAEGSGLFNYIKKSQLRESAALVLLGMCTCVLSNVC